MTVRVRVQQRPALDPVLIARVGLEDLRAAAGQRAAHEAAAELLGDMVEQQLIGKREYALGSPSPDMLAVRAEWLCKAVVEESAARASDVVENTVEHLAAVLVAVEPEADDIVQHPP